jgi:GH35 family endo-1,4-beta-xylanase
MPNFDALWAGQRMPRRRFLGNALGAALLAGNPVLGHEPKEPEPDLLAGAGRRIERHRTTAGSITLRKPNGRPIPGARLRVEQLRHTFLFGSRYDAIGDTTLAAAYNQRFSTLLNDATLCLAWPQVVPTQGKPDYTTIDAAVDWCQRHLITCLGHPLVWDHLDWSPKWLPKILLAVGELSSDYVEAMVSHYRGRIDRWCVVNEPTHLGNPLFAKEAASHLGQYGASIGPRAYTTEYLQVARAASPQANLMVNDYQTDVAYCVLLESLKANGRYLFDTVGLQSHMHQGPWPLTQLWKICELFAGLGLPLSFTETTVVSGPSLGSGDKWGATTPELEAKQADYVERYYTLLFSHPAVQAITWWDLSDLGGWRGAASGLLRKDLSPKPAYDRLHRLIKNQWWTKVSGPTDKAGVFRWRGFHGFYRILVELPNGSQLTRSLEWNPQTARHAEIVVG